jgi:hypothetical protein
VLITPPNEVNRLAVDFHDLPRYSEGRNSVILITDRWSGFIWEYYLVERRAGAIILALKYLFVLLDRQYQIKPKVVECDNEIPVREQPHFRT